MSDDLQSKSDQHQIEEAVKQAESPLQLAHRLVGLKEQGGANCGPVQAWSVEWLGGGPSDKWCAGFLSRLLWHFGMIERKQCSLSARMLLANVRQIPGAHNVLRAADGDVVFFANKDGVVSHCGIVKRGDLAKISTIEGNSNNAVSERRRVIDEKTIMIRIPTQPTKRQ